MPEVAYKRVVIANDDFKSKEIREKVIKDISSRPNTLRINSYEFKKWENYCTLFLDIVIGGDREIEINQFVTQLQIDFSKTGVK